MTKQMEDPLKKPALRNHYRESVVPALKQKRGYKNPHQIPAIAKVVINSGFDASVDKNGIAEIVKDLGLITGQKPIVTRAKKSISNFKVREGMPVGAKVTLRGAVMWHFLYRLIIVALPGIRDFRGVGRKMDGQGNYTLGITDHTIFPEIGMSDNKSNLGLDITIVTTAGTDAEAEDLLAELGMPFRKKETGQQAA